MTYKIIYLSEVVKKHIPSLSSSVKLVIRDAIERKLSTDPLTYGKPLRYSLKGHRRIRVGNYRVIYRIESNTVIIIAIAHRKEAYD